MLTLSFDQAQETFPLSLTLPSSRTISQQSGYQRRHEDQQGKQADEVIRVLAPE
jgi:hypothetical protein